LKMVALTLTTTHRSAWRVVAAIPECVPKFKPDVAPITASCLRVRQAPGEHEQRYEYLRRVAGIFSATTREHATFFLRAILEGAQANMPTRPLAAFGELRRLKQQQTEALNSGVTLRVRNGTG
jgi:hypothetical protein